MPHHHHPFAALFGAQRAIQLAGSSVLDTAGVGTVVGILSVSSPIGVYTFTLTSNPGVLFSISGNQLKVAAALSDGIHPITIQANNGAGSILNNSFAIVVSPPASSGYVPTFELLGF